LLSAHCADRRRIVERDRASAVEQLTKPLCICEGTIRSPNANRVGPNDHGNRFSMARDRHFLASNHPIENLGKRSSRLAG
jgi:hypothetical protein